MMERQTVTVSSLAIAFALFEVGSTTLFLIGAEANQDAWIAMSLAAAIGFVLLMLYMAIYRADPHRDLFALCRFYLGRWLGNAFGFSFAAYFAYEASRNLRDLAELTMLILLNRTPLFVLLTITVLVVANTARYGAKVLFYTCLVLLPMMAVSYLFLNIMFVSMNLIRFQNMLPVLENGWGPVWQAAVPRIVSFPFGQSVLFLVFFPLAKASFGRLRSAVYVSYAVIAVVLIFLNQVNILVLGTGIAKNSMVPLLESVQLIEFANVFERMDIFFVLVLFLGLGIKMAAFLIGATTGLHKVTGIGYKKCVPLIGGAVYALSFSSPNYVHHIWLGKVVTYWDPLFQIALPAILLIVIWARHSKKASVLKKSE